MVTGVVIIKARLLSGSLRMAIKRQTEEYRTTHSQRFFCTPKHRRLLLMELNRMDWLKLSSTKEHAQLWSLE
jgi:hypothetical protein